MKRQTTTRSPQTKNRPRVQIKQAQKVGKTYTLSEDVSDQILFNSWNTLKTIGDVDAIPEKAKRFFLNFIDSEDESDLELEKNIRFIGDNVFRNILHVKVAVEGSQLRTIKESYLSEVGDLKDLGDIKRSWGYRWLSEGDKAFNESEY